MALGYGYPGVFAGNSWIVWFLLLLVLFLAFIPFFRGGRVGTIF